MADRYKSAKWWREDATEEQARERGERLEATVRKLREALSTCMLDRDSWKGEVRNLLHTRPCALGARSEDIIAELNAELAAKREREVARG